MKRRQILIGVLVLLVVIQFIHPARNADAGISNTHIEKMYPVSADVQAILKKACYDCHSNYTVYPWYSKLQPVDWWLTHHINEGKEELNFSEFGTYPLKKQAHKLKEVIKEVEEGEMPLSSYTLIHTNAKLTAGERQSLISWAKDLSGKLTGFVASR